MSNLSQLESEMARQKKEFNRKRAELAKKIKEEKKLAEEQKLAEAHRLEKINKLNQLAQTIAEINESISTNHQKINASIPNFDQTFQNYGFRLLESARSSKLGATFDMLSKTPREIIAAHKRKVADGDAYDNYYEIYNVGNSKYIVGCARCLQFWDHACETKIYELKM